jgi:Bacterial SH3 domain
METEASLRNRLDGLADNSQYNSAEFWASPVAPIETPAPADARVSFRVRTLQADEDDPPQLSQHTNLSRGQRSFGPGRPITGLAIVLGLGRSFGSGRNLTTGIAVALVLGLSALAYFLLASPSEKTITQTAELASRVPSAPATLAAEAAPRVAPAAATSRAAPAVATPIAAPAAAAWPPSPPLMNSERPPEPVQVSSKVAQSPDVLYLQRPGVNIRSTPSPTGSAVGTAPKGTRFKVTNRQGDWIQVEGGRLKGWINAGFLAPSEPR